ncbi:MAG: baseplate J/gp47 family protein [Bacteroidota bacterium]
MNKSCVHKNPLTREGTTQLQRLLDALVPENVKLHELKVEDWMAFAKNYASLINYYDSTNAQTTAGDWQDFFVAEDEIGAFLETVNDGNSSPHLSLFIAFLNLLQYPQNSLNELPKRHLDFYYRDVLRLSPKSFTPDSVHVLFELAKNAVSELVEKHSNFEAGKDSEGNILNYKLDKDIVANKASIAQIKGIFLNEKENEEDEDQPLKYALQSNTLDGLEEPLTDDLSWSAFGSTSWAGDLPAEVVLSSNLFLMSEGVRIVGLTWTIADDGDMPDLNNAVAHLSGAEGWLDPLEVLFTPDKKIWYFLIPEDFDAITYYDEEVHGRNINTQKPTLIVSFKNTNNYRALKDVKISSVKIDTYVYGVKNLKIKNELGNQAPDTPFMPFGSRPKKNSSLRINVPEFEDKSISTYTLNMSWPDLPDNFTTHYRAYHAEIKKLQNTQDADFQSFLDAMAFTGTYSNDSTVIDNQIKTLTPNDDPMKGDFRVEVSSPYNSGGSTFRLFEQSISSNVVSENNGRGDIVITLKSSLYHDLYNPIYVNAVTFNQNGVNVDQIPKEPYTPFTEGLIINYSATGKIDFVENEVTDVSTEMYHVTPFGSEQVTENATLVPNFLNNSLFIGIQNGAPQSVISLLFQVAEGTENPDLNTFIPTEQIKWYVLAEGNKWEALDNKILFDDTNNFLRSGIVELELPRETSLEHHLMESGLVWLKVTLNNEPESVSKFYNIHAQACTATFSNTENSLEHLTTGLNPGLITQLAQRKSKIKSVSQPYSSFGGKDTESDVHFYRRISERLRHKDRALTIWDYEHLILQEFPQLHKVKCLNHTRKTAQSVDEISPGNVTIVVIPKIKDSGSEYRLTPKVSQNTREEIKTFLKPKKPMHAQVEVANPIYEQVTFSFLVKFYEGKDYNFHKTLIHEDIKAYISPWIREEELNLKFGKSIYKYEVINFLENLEYVDYLESFTMFHTPYGGDPEEKNEIFPSNSLAVLVANSAHDIEPVTPC